jgi:twitching motility protein PilT
MHKATVDALITSMLNSGEGASDLLFLAGKPPLVEIRGQLRPFPIDTPESLLTPELIETIAERVTQNNARLQEQFETTGSCDCSYSIDDVARFRVNTFKQNGRRAIVMRKLQSSVPTLESVGLPPVFREIVKEKNGIVLVTGALGSGKSTTLAAMIDELNQTHDIHILTLEDPIEFVHSRARAAVSHRELGKDFPSFAEGLRAALRQGPKVIMVGEIRDRETMEIAMIAAETGHLVFSTLHTTNTGQSINRVLEFFSRDEETQMRERLAETLRYLISQKLINGKADKRILITEVMGSNAQTRETIRCGESETTSFRAIIEAGTILGWHTFDQSLLRARQADLITDETAMTHCTNKSAMRRGLDLLAGARGAAEPEMTSGSKHGPPQLPITKGDGSPLSASISSS